MAKKDKQLLDNDDVYRLIQQYAKAESTKPLTREQLKIVFKAYRDIMYMAMQKDVRLNLPYIGEFDAIDKKGWDGGFVTFRKDFGYGFADNDIENKQDRAYFEPKPNYKSIQLNIKPCILDKFREETEVPRTQEEIDELRLKAELKEKEKLKNE